MSQFISQQEMLCSVVSVLPSNIVSSIDDLAGRSFDYVVAGAGLSGAVFARAARDAGHSVLVVERREHIAGNIFTSRLDDIELHVYGAHIFHTSDRGVWDYVCRYASFNNYINAPVARFEDELYNLPFNMNTFSKLWGVYTPAEAEAVLEAQRAEVLSVLDGRKPANLEEQALSLVGRDIYEKLICGYTEKQWGRPCRELPADIIKRLPVRMIYDNNYFNDRFQGVPEDGYTQMVSNILGDVPVLLGVDYRDLISRFPNIANKTVYTGPIDEFFDYSLGALEWRSLRFDTQKIDCANYQGNAVVNYTAADVPYTRVIEHKHFQMNEQLDNPVSYITHEYPADWSVGDAPYYPVNNDENQSLYENYLKLAEERDDIIFAGRLGGYRYYDMDKAIAAAFELVKEELDVDLRQ